MSQSEKPTAPPDTADARALEYAKIVAEHDRKLRERGVRSSGVLRALALSYGLDTAAE